jgi:uncharacterized lipoprotein YmbA
MPHAIADAAPAQKFDFPAGVFIGVGPVRIPDYMDRPQMITRGKDGLLNVAQFERWAELVDAAMMRMIDENLMLMLPAAHVVKFPWGIDIPVRYQVAMDVVEMDADLEKDLEMVVRWQVMDAASRQAVFSKRSELVQAITPHDYFGLNEALSAATAALSSEIAEQLSIVAKRGEGRK